MSYFRNILDAATTIFEGLAITSSHIFRKPITVQYPDRMIAPMSETMAGRYRGFLEVETKICTGCTMCMQACPIACIDIEITKAETRLISRFAIDISKCMFCGLCVEACPTKAIHFTKGFERATPDIKTLLLRFVDEGHPVVPYKKGSA